MKKVKSKYSRKQVGEKHPCEYCGKMGTVEYDPYMLEIRGQEMIVCLCNDCYKKECEEI